MADGCMAASSPLREQGNRDRGLNTAERETETVKAQVRRAPGLRDQAGQLKDDYQGAHAAAGNGSTNGATSATYAERPVDLRASDPSAETRQI